MTTVSDFYKDQSEIGFETWEQRVNDLIQEVDASPTFNLAEDAEGGFEVHYKDGYTPVEAVASRTEGAVASDISSLTIGLEAAEEAIVRLAGSETSLGEPARAATRYNNFAGSWKDTAKRFASALGKVLKETGHLNEEKVTVDRDVVKRLIDSMLNHTEPLASANGAVDYIIARRQIGNPLVQAGEQLPRFMHDGRFEPDENYGSYTEETRNLMYRLTQVLQEGETAQSDIREEDLPPIEELRAQEEPEPEKYEVTYIQRVDEQATVTVEASSEEEAIQKAKEGDYKGEMNTTFVDWVHGSFKHPEVEPLDRNAPNGEANGDNAEKSWRAETAAKIDSLEEEHSFIETVLGEHDISATDVIVSTEEFIEPTGFRVDEERYRAEIIASVSKEPPVKVAEEIRFYRNDQPGRVVGELEIPDSLQPLLRSYLDRLKDALEDAIGGFEINTRAAI